jgi:5-methyltetrahydrofolate--homocysteine methyltransferase
MNVLDRISESLQRGEDQTVASLVREAMEQDLPATAILDDGLIAGMNVVGERFRIHEIFLPDVLLAAKAMYAGMELLKPLLMKEKIASRGKVVIGSVQGDLHDIGKNLVGILLRGAGFEVIDLGNDVPPERFVETAQKESAPVIGLSALLTTTMPVMRQVVARLEARGLAGQVKVIVGGAPVSAEFATDIGADAYGFDAANAVDRVKSLLGVS